MSWESKRDLSVEDESSQAKRACRRLWPARIVPDLGPSNRLHRSPVEMDRDEHYRRFLNCGEYSIAKRGAPFGWPCLNDHMPSPPEDPRCLPRDAQYQITLRDRLRAGRTRQTLANLLQQAAPRGPSDLHIAAGFPPTFRVGGELVPAELPALWADDTAHLVGELLIEAGFGDQFERFLTDHTEIDCGLSLEGAGRVRANVYLAQHAVAGAFRLVRGYVPTIPELDLPDVALSLVQNPQGCSSSQDLRAHGKTTSQAALLQALAQRVRRHILTIEDPIEYTLVADLSLVCQREVGSDTSSFASGLRAALREDPDVLLVGEMRDLETISTALTAAETGHLVITTLHTHDAVSAVDRIVDVFPAGQQS